jgi:hypothetical protein
LILAFSPETLIARGDDPYTVGGILPNPHFISNINKPAFNDFGEDTFPGHDAIPHGFVDNTTVVTFLSYLCYPENHIAAFKKGSHRQTTKINTFHHQVFPKGPVFNLGAFGSELFDFIM